MNPFPKLPAPSFWAEKEAQWEACAGDWARLDPLGWRHQGKSLRAWFHELCRDPSEPALCAYCDGELYVTARATVDHVAPRRYFQALSLAWHNLLPVCDLCNETYKREQWSCALVRPDVDPVEAWFDVELSTGALRPSPEIDDPVIRARVRLTIRVLGLNTLDRRKARRNVVRACRNAWKREEATTEHDRSMVHELCQQGPYRLVARRARDALAASSNDP